MYAVNDPESQMNPQSKMMEYNPRLGFVRKVYGILTAQLLVTCIFVAVFHSVQFFIDLVCSNGEAGYNCIPSASGMGFLYFCMAVNFIVMFMMVCCLNNVRKVPTNYILLTIFTLTESYMVAWICVLYSAGVVLTAAAATASITFALTIYAWTTKTDITYYGGLLFILGWALFFFGVMAIWGGSTMAYTAYLVLGCVLYAFYLIYDTQLIMGGKRYKLSMDDYILGALFLYVDIIVMFLRILALLGRK